MQESKKEPFTAENAEGTVTHQDPYLPAGKLRCVPMKGIGPDPMNRDAKNADSAQDDNQE